MTRLPGDGFSPESKRAPRYSQAARQTTRFAGLTNRELVEIYRLLLTSRFIDDREIKMKRQQKVFFQISAAGHELPGICAGKLLRPGYDWFYTYYRDRALALTLGLTPEECFLQAVGAWTDPGSGGRQMPSHFGHPDLHLVTGSSPTGTQLLQAAGSAQVGQICRAVEELRAQKHRYERDEVVHVSAGDGTTSQGEFWETLNSACVHKLPLLIVIEDNGYAISVPTASQTPGGSISKAFRGLDDLKILECDGCDVADTYRTMAEAIDHVRRGSGPAMVHAHVVRPYSHSMSDDERKYKPAELRAAEQARDPFHTMADLLIAEQILTLEELDGLKAEVSTEVDEAAQAALTAPPPPAHTADWYVYSPDVDPCSDAFCTVPDFRGDQRTMVDLLNRCLSDEMARDPRMVIFGEDVADAPQGMLAEVKGKGGVFTVTLGLQRRFGDARVFNSPLAEANIIGRALGMAVRDLKPVVEIQFFDYIWPAFHQLRNELATLRWRSNNTFKAPVVIRVPIGGYLKGGAPYHSQSGEVLFTHIPGLRVVMPSTALDASGLLRTAIRCDDPVLFLEPKQLYRQTFNKSADPGPDFTIPFGRARLVLEGSDLTIITYGNLVHRSVKAAEIVAEEAGIEVEVIDLRSLSPYDWDAISESVKKTSKVIVAHEDHVSWGYGAEIAARVADELFEWLDGPVRRVGGMDTFVAYHPDLERAILPQVDDLVDTIRDLAEY